MVRAIIAMAKRVRASHLIVILLALIWLELGGLESARSWLLTSKKGEQPAPLGVHDEVWVQEFERAKYGEAASQPSR